MFRDLLKTSCEFNAKKTKAGYLGRYKAYMKILLHYKKHSEVEKYGWGWFNNIWVPSCDEILKEEFRQKTDNNNNNNDEDSTVDENNDESENNSSDSSDSDNGSSTDSSEGKTIYEKDKHKGSKKRRTKR